MTHQSYHSDVQTLADFLREHPSSGVSSLIAAILVSVAFQTELRINLARISTALDSKNMKSVLNVIACRYLGWPDYILSDDDLHDLMRKYRLD